MATKATNDYSGFEGNIKIRTKKTIQNCKILGNAGIYAYIPIHYIPILNV